MLLAHIITGALSIIVAIIAIIWPRRPTLIIDYLLISLVVITGTVLLFTIHVNFVRIVATIIFYLAIVAALVVIAERRLARRTANQNNL